MRKILITGASGLLGSCLCKKLSALQYNVTGVTHSNIVNPVSDVNYLTVDLSSDWKIESLPQNIDTVIHLAQSSNFRDFPKSALDVFKVNIESTARLLDYASRSGASQFIYASSGGVYGNGTQAFKENAPIVPLGQLGYYLGSKTCGEILVQSYASLLQVVVLRPFFMYGPGQNRSMLIPRLYDSVKNGKTVSLQGNSGIRINPIHVEDASNAVNSALSLNESAIFNVAGPEILSIRDICDGLGKYLGIAPVYEEKAGETSDLIADISAMRDLLTVPNRKILDNISDIDSNE